MWNDWIWPAIKVAILTIIGRGLVLFVEGHGYRPSEWVADMLDNAVDTGAAAWLISGAFGVIVMLAWEGWIRRGKTAKADSRSIISDQLQKDRLALADEVTRIRMMVTRGGIPADQKTSIFAGTERYTDRLDGDEIAAFLWRDFAHEVQQFVTTQKSPRRNWRRLSASGS